MTTETPLEAIEEPQIGRERGPGTTDSDTADPFWGEIEIRDGSGKTSSGAASVCKPVWSGQYRKRAKQTSSDVGLLSTTEIDGAS
jgi:hypothetical protein